MTEELFTIISQNIYSQNRQTIMQLTLRSDDKRIYVTEIPGAEFSNIVKEFGLTLYSDIVGMEAVASIQDGEIRSIRKAE